MDDRCRTFWILIVFAAVVALSVLTASSAEFTNPAWANDDAKRSGRSLLVLVSAEWCPPCQTLKATTIAQARREGLFIDINYVEVPSDGPDAKELIGDRPLPQLVYFQREGDGWRKVYRSGVVPLKEFREFIGK